MHTGHVHHDSQKNRDTLSESYSPARASADHLGECSSVCLNDAHNHAEETKGAAKDLDDEHLDEELWPLSIAQGATTARDTHADAADKVGEANGEAHRNHHPPCSHGVCLPALLDSCWDCEEIGSPH